MVIFLSKYFSKAKENKNNEKTEIKIDGINVNNEKNIIYFLLVVEPLIFMSSLSEFLTSIKIIIKKIKSNATFNINKN